MRMTLQNGNPRKKIAATAEKIVKPIPLFLRLQSDFINP